MTDQLEALMHESDQVDAQIGRVRAVLHRSVGIFLPVSFSFFLLVSKFGEKLDLGVAGFLFACFSTVATLYSNLLWSELMLSIRFKFTVIYPEIFRVSGQDRSDNHGSFILNNANQKQPAVVAFLHSCMFILVSVISFHWALKSTAPIQWSVAIIFMVALGVFGTVCAGQESKATKVEIQKKYPPSIKKSTRSRV